MKKSVIIAILIIVILAAGAAGVYFYANRTKTATPSATVTQNTAPTPVPLLWDDPAGFTFTYNPDLSVNKHDEDQENYAHVELTTATNPGNIIVWASDTTAADVGAWVNTEKTFQGANIIDTTLGSQPAKKIILTTPSRKVITGAVYDELLFTVETDPADEGYWLSEYQKIADSFTFKPLPEDNTGDESGDATAGEVVDEEEVLE